MRRLCSARLSAIGHCVLAIAAFVSETSASDPWPAKGPFFPVDERVIEDRWHVRRVVAPLQRHPDNPLLTKKYPWEGVGPSPQTVLHDPADGLLKMWYTVWDEYNYDNGLPFSYNICYAESRDGFVWKRPFLGVFEYHGNTQNNCIRLGKYRTQNIDVEVDPRSDANDRRFVAIHNDKKGVMLSTCTFGENGPN